MPTPVSTDFFTVPTFTMKVLFVFIVLEHRRRKVLHFDVIEHPTAAWTAQQFVEAFADREPTNYLIRDRDSIYGTEVRLRIKSLGMEEVVTAPQSPWQKSMPSGNRLHLKGVSQPLRHSECAPSQKNTIKSVRYYNIREPI